MRLVLLSKQKLKIIIIFLKFSVDIVYLEWYYNQAVAREHQVMHNIWYAEVSELADEQD